MATEDTEQRAMDAMKSIRVSLDDGHLTDMSIAMILIELKRQNLKITPYKYHPRPRS